MAMMRAPDGRPCHRRRPRVRHGTESFDRGQR